MKTKFTLLIAAGLLFSVATMAQDRGYENDHRNDGYRNDFRQERHEDYNYKTRICDLQQKLSCDINELDRARECGDWEKVHYEKREIAQIRDEMRHINYHRWSDQQDEFGRNHDYNSRF
jgi:hypothetical protein